MRALTLVVPVAAAVAGAVLLAPSASATAPRSAAAGGVAGYEVTSGGHTSATATWLVPTVTCGSGESDLELWTGLDGIGSATLEQAGIEIECSSGQVFYSAVTEVYPAAPVYSTMTVSPGDLVTGAVSVTGGTATLSVTDTTTGQRDSRTAATTGTGSSAEVLAECDAACPGYVSLSVTGARVDGGTLGAAGPVAVSGDPGTPTALTGGTAFRIVRS